MAKTPKNSLFIKRAKALKDAGLVNFDLRKNPTDYEKRKARENYKRYRDIIQHPDNYTVKTISAKTAKAVDADKARKKLKSGKVKVWINNEGGKEVKFQRGGVFKIGNSGDSFSRIVYPGGKDIFKTAEKVFKKFPKEDKDGKNYVMVNIGADKDFSKSATFDKESFNHYINTWNPKDAEKMDPKKAETLRDQLISRMNVVKIYNPKGFNSEGSAEHATKKKRSKKVSRN